MPLMRQLTLIEQSMLIGHILPSCVQHLAVLVALSCFNALCFTWFIVVNSVRVSLNISYSDLS